MAVHVHSPTPEGSTDIYSIKNDGQAFLCELYCRLFKKGLTSANKADLFIHVCIYLLVIINL